MAASHTPTRATKGGTEAVARALGAFVSEDGEEACVEDGLRVRIVDDNIFRWQVELFGYDASTQLAQDLFLYESARPDRAPGHVLLEVIFPPSFPAAPPFIRVVYPRFFQWTGHITSGGSVCVEELTLSGWDPAFDLRAFLVMVRHLLVAGGALIDIDAAHRDYSEDEARAAFDRVAEAHGWV